MTLLDIQTKGSEILGNIGILDEVVEERGVLFDYAHGMRPSCVKEDFFTLSDKYFKATYSDIKKPYSDDALAIAIVAEVLEHHNIKFSLNELLSIYEIGMDLFDSMNHDIRIWSRTHYWRNCIEYWESKWNNHLATSFSRNR